MTTWAKRLRTRSTSPISRPDVHADSTYVAPQFFDVDSGHAARRLHEILAGHAAASARKPTAIAHGAATARGATTAAPSANATPAAGGMFAWELAYVTAPQRIPNS